MIDQSGTCFVQGHSVQDADAAMKQALAGVVTCSGALKRTSSHDRAVILDRLATRFAERQDKLAHALADESGYLSVTDMQLEVTRSIEVLTLTAAQVRQGSDQTLNLDAVDRARGAVGFVRRQPIGPVLGITAYNGPLLIPVHKVAPAIAVGAPIVLKPAPRVAGAALDFARMVVEAGWPADAIAVLNVDNDRTMQLIKDPRLSVISFTGGPFGWQIKEAVPRKHVHLELGGVGAVFVAADANLALAARECAAGGYVRSGQSCISVQRIYVERPVVEEFTALLTREVEKLQPGQPNAISPMVDESAASRVENVIATAVKDGAKIVTGGQRDGASLSPAILTHATPTMSIMRQEAFGPVVAVATVDDADEAVAQINDVPGAIHNGIYTANLDLAMRLADEIRAAGVIVNGPGTWRVDHMPYGGTGTSGFGREGVRFAMEEYTEPKSIILRPSVPA